MEIKYTVQGLLIYIALAAYLAAFTAALPGKKRAAHLLYVGGFGLAVGAFAYRWRQAGHVPLQNLFEVFLCLGVIVYPVTSFCRRVLRVGAEWADMLLGVIVLFPAGFIFSAEPQQLPPALQSPLFLPHVAAYMLAYIFMAKACVQAVQRLAGGRACLKDGLVSHDQAAYRMICAGFPLLTIGLLLGSVWGKLAWGDYWGWDPKEMWGLVCWLVYVGYFHFRRMFGTKYPRINSLWVISGMAAIVVTLLWVNLSKLFAGLHSYAV